MLAPSDITEPYVDLLGDEDPTGRLPSQRLMASRALPLIYERIWRPLGGRVLMRGIDMAAEHRRALEMLGCNVAEGERRRRSTPAWQAKPNTVLDVACGTGGFTRRFAEVAGIAIGVDASRTMLAEAVRKGGGAKYVRASASALPFEDASFDGVCCFAALYLIEEPYEAIAEMARVLAPGGRVALLSSVVRGPVPARVADLVVRPVTGIRMFGRDDLRRALVSHGLVDVRVRVSGFGQFVSARRP